MNARQTLLMYSREAVAALVSAAAASLLILACGAGLPPEGVDLIRIVVPAGVLFLCSFFLEIFADERMANRFWRGIAVEASVCLAALAFLYQLMPEFLYGPEVIVVTVLFFVFLQLLIYSGSALTHLPAFARKVLILGTGPLANQIGSVILTRGKSYVLSGFVRCAAERVSVPAAQIVADEEDLLEAVRREKTDQLVVSLSERRGVLPIREVMKCKLTGVAVTDAASFYEEVTGKLWVETLNPSSIVFSDGYRIGQISRWCKRGLDLCLASLALALLLPFYPLVALLIRLDSPGPVIFRQRRVGEMEKEFDLYKFRTMRSDAEAATGAVWAAENDPRITSPGRFLRRTRIDELPQLVNVLRGDMSLVGPRPERPEFVRELREQVPYYSQRHFVKPGVTGWAQVRYRYGASVEDALEKLRYDLYYIKNYSVVFDLMVMAETVKVILFRRGGR